MQTVFDQFTGLYSLSKTLRFELKPIGQTKELLEDFYKHCEGNPIVVDEQRICQYPKMKDLLDDYYRLFIDKTLSRPIFSAEEITKAYELYCAAKQSHNSKQKESKYQKEYTAAKKSLRKKLAACFAEQKEEFGLDKYSHLFGSEQLPLNCWLQSRLQGGQITAAEYEEGLAALKAFERFTTYFTGFKENRDNLFAEVDKASAIANRVIEENMEKHFFNCRALADSTQKYPQLAEELGSFLSFFMPAYYGSCLSQQGIDCYNQAIGKELNGDSTKGVNQIINEYRQKYSLKTKDLPTLITLHKQLLSKKPDCPVSETLTTDQEMLQLAKYCYTTAISRLNELQKIMSDYLNDENLQFIYLKTKDLNALSKKMFGEWDTIRNAYFYHCQQLTDKEQKRFAANTKEVISLGLLQRLLNSYLPGSENPPPLVDPALYFKSFDLTPLRQAYEAAAPVLALTQLDQDKAPPNEGNPKGGLGYRQTILVKNLLDTILRAKDFYKPFLLEQDGKPIAVADSNELFYTQFTAAFAKLNCLYKKYNLIRSYASQKPFSTDKFKLNFNNSTLLSGWDLNKEEENTNILLRKDGQYYLGILKNTKLFADCSKYLCQDSVEHYEKMVYKQVSGVNKMFPKVFFAAKNLELYKPPAQILQIKAQKSHLKEANNPDAKNAWIDFCKDSIAKSEWPQYFKFKFKPSEQYPDVNSFYREADAQMYSLTFQNVAGAFVKQAVENGELYLFEIYNKDFSAYSKGKPNLHTLYWQMLFDEHNLCNIADNAEQPVFKLNGEAEIFYRKASLDDRVTHPAKKPIDNKNPLNGKKTSTFAYDLKKDRRYMQNKLYFHCPITINFRRGTLPQAVFNYQVNSFLQNNPQINLLGIDRGEKNLLYYTLINQRGQILKQGSFNQITAAGNTTDYHKLLAKKEQERAQARQDWGTLEQIKDLKAGYLSYVIHELTCLMIKNNAVIVLESLSKGFKAGRQKIEKQVYQRFEKALIDKLNYLVFKEAAPFEAGHCLKGYQLTAPFESFEKLYNQSGFLYYVVPSYTSKICPQTGFVNLFNSSHLNYRSVKASQEFLQKFSNIRYNGQADYFEFAFDYKSFFNAEGKTNWTACTYGQERYCYYSKEKLYQCHNVTGELKKLFAQYGLTYQTGCDLRGQICAQTEKSFFSRLLFLLKLTLQLRYGNGGTKDSDDYILSPVADQSGRFFDSRTAREGEPQNADANGAYHIALKGLRLLKGLDCGKTPTAKNERAEWLKFAQERKYLEG